MAETGKLAFRGSLKWEKRVKNNPKRYLERLVGEDVYKLRVGDYRVFVDPLFSRNILVVRSVKHRSVAYGR